MVAFIISIIAIVVVVSLMPAIYYMDWKQRKLNTNYPFIKSKRIKEKK